ncbi:DUF4142 domain-containing protein [Saccharophagus sp. K07]|uniref:DUF4142 domain-containing protein n=1 Tax=Saccharophagus sp. K07 TaxID=2283636 RepID=UPI0016529DE6|nr:DUF4142 domain-containing protein [Saccharophagus sp. K07]MBC6905423.1 DUF4142 domain-containing protein [Saccharophagus sp. K07]
MKSQSRNKKLPLLFCTFLASFAPLAITASQAESAENHKEHAHKQHNDNKNKLSNSNEMSLQKHVEGTIEPQAFVEQASASGAAEIELAKLALQKSTQVDVREFAQTMIEDHQRANTELRELAQHTGLTIADEATLTQKAKAFVLQQKEGESFDVAYAKHQVTAHEKTVKLFRLATNSSANEIKEFAEAKLPTLEYHLTLARGLVDSVSQIHSSGDRTSKGSHNPKSTDSKADGK